RVDGRPAASAPAPSSGHRGGGRPAASGREVMAAARVRILLVDDHAVVREGLRVVLDECDDLVVVGECGSGDQAIKQAAALRPDVVLMDLKMPGLSAAEAIGRIREAHAGTQCMVFSSFSSEQQLRACLDAGAIGFLLKDALISELAEAVRA